MTDVETTPVEGDEPEAEVTPEDMINRGKGIKAENLEAGSAAAQAWEDFKVLVAEQQEAVAEGERQTDARNQAIFALKNEHNISFGSIAEVIGGTSSLVMYLFERAQGKSAKQIREEHKRSAAAKAKFAESDPNRKPVRKQSDAEKQLRKQQREQLKALLEEEKARAAAAGEAPPDELSDDDDDDE